MMPQPPRFPGRALGDLCRLDLPLPRQRLGLRWVGGEGTHRFWKWEHPTSNIEHPTSNVCPGRKRCQPRSPPATALHDASRDPTDPAECEASGVRRVHPTSHRTPRPCGHCLSVSRFAHRPCENRKRSGCRSGRQNPSRASSAPTLWFGCRASRASTERR